MKYNAERYLNNWTNAKFSPSRLATAKNIVLGMTKNKVRYSDVERRTGVPWWFTFIIHNREANGRFDSYLGNGDPLDRPTNHVPSGRGPFKSWEDGAIDALTYEGFNKITDWSIPHALYLFEKYNGFGYANKGLPSPYVWSGSSIYTKGKYVADGKYDSNVVDAQLGAAIMLEALLSSGLLNALTGQGAQSTNVTVGTTPTLTNMVGVAVGSIFTGLGLAGFGADAFHTIGAVAGLFGALAAMTNQLHITGSSDNNTLDLIARFATTVRDAAARAETGQAPTMPPAGNG